MAIFTRREFLRGLGLAGASWARPSGTHFWPPGAEDPAKSQTRAGASVLFEAAPSAASGIAWQHPNGRSEEFFAGNDRSGLFLF